MAGDPDRDREVRRAEEAARRERGCEREADDAEDRARDALRHHDETLREEHEEGE